MRPLLDQVHQISANVRSLECSFQQIDFRVDDLEAAASHLWESGGNPQFNNDKAEDHVQRSVQRIRNRCEERHPAQAAADSEVIPEVQFSLTLDPYFFSESSDSLLALIFLACHHSRQNLCQKNCFLCLQNRCHWFKKVWNPEETRTSTQTPRQGRLVWA